MVRVNPRRTLKQIDGTAAAYIKAYSSQNYDEAARIMEELIEDFTPYINKYVALSKSKNNQDINNKDTQQFLALFLSPDKRRQVDMVSAKNFFQAVLEGLESEEIFNELVIVFIDLANQYDPSNRVGFTRYITQYMKWEISRWVKRFKTEPLVGMRPVFEFTEEIGPDDEFALMPDLDMPEITLGWVFDCNRGPFAVLSHYERCLLYLKFKEGKTTDQIAEKTQRSHGTIVKDINEAISKVAIVFKKGE